MTENPDSAKKIQIFKTAVKRFEKHGFKKTTLDEIARDLRQGKSSLYHYFKSKEDLIAQTIKWRMGIYIQEINNIFEQTEKTLEEKLAEYVLFKENFAEQFKLLFELLLHCLNNDSLEYEAVLQKELISSEYDCLNNILAKEKILNKNQAGDLAKEIVDESWGNFFIKKIKNNLQLEEQTDKEYYINFFKKLI